MKAKSSLSKSLSYIVSRFIFKKKFLTAYSPKYNLKLKFITQDGGGRAIYKTGLYEERLIHFILNKVRIDKEGIILDVGANIGWYSNLLGKLKPEASIHSFEPDPTNFELLTHNLQQNKVTNVRANKMGVGEKNEVKKLYLYKNSNIGRHSMLDINEGPFIEVNLTSLDEYMAQQELSFDKLNFLKIDIEGYEYFAFLGATKCLEHLPIILAEFSPGYMRKGNVEPNDLLTLLRKHNYSPYVIEALQLRTITDKELLGMNTNINLIWVKNGNEIIDRIS